MRPPRDYGWNPIESALLDEDIALQVTDGRGAPYTLQWPCKRTPAGGINSRKGTPLEVTPVRWRPYPIPPSRLDDIPLFPAPNADAPGRQAHVGRERRGRAKGDALLTIPVVSVRRAGKAVIR
jgi:hypothetical protein